MHLKVATPWQLVFTNQLLFCSPRNIHFKIATRTILILEFIGKILINFYTRACGSQWIRFIYLTVV